MKKYEIDRYVSELGDNFLRGMKKVVIDAPTNSGKTHCIINYCKRKYNSGVYYADTILLAKQMANEHSLEFHSADNPAPYGSTWISTVYNHYPKFTLEGCNATIEDEFHTYVSDYSYKSDVIDKVEKFSDLNDIRFLLSGTVLDIPKDFNHIKIERKQQPEFIIQVLTDFLARDRTNLLLSEIMKGIAAGKQVWVSFFDKSSNLPSYVKTLEKNGIRRDEISMINADTKEGDPFNQLVMNRRIDKCKVVFTTFVQGFNIDGNSTNYKLIILPNPRAKHSWADIVQIYNRFRDNNGELEAKILWDGFTNKNYKTLDQIYNEELKYYYKLFEEEKARLENKYFKFSRMSQGHFDTTLSQWIIDEERLGLVKADLNINEAKLKYNLLNKMTNIMWTDFKIMKDLIAQGGITIEAIESSFKAYKLLEEEEKDQLIEVREKARLKTNYDALKDVENADGLDIGAPYYFPFMKLLEITGDFQLSKKGIIECYGNNQRMKALKDELRLRYASDMISKTYRRYVYEFFEIGKKYTNSNILVIFQNIANQIDENKHIDSTNKAVRTLRKFFEIETSNGGSGKDTIRYYKIVQRK